VLCGIKEYYLFATKLTIIKASSTNYLKLKARQ
jgi:hypothetical protein